MAKSKPAEKPETVKPEIPAPNSVTTENPVAETVTKVTPAELNSVVELPAPNERTIQAMAEDSGQPGAIPPVASPTATPSPVSSSDPKPGDLDDAGQAFDPEKHNPRRNRHGKWAGKQGRPPGGGKPAATPSAPKPDVPKSVVGTVDGAPTATPGAAAIGDRFDLAAELYTRAGYSVMDGICAGGGEWLPESDGEHVALRGAVATYLRHKGTDDLPPGLAVGLALATYGAKRISKPNTATRLRMYMAWLRAKWHVWRTGREIEQLPRAQINPTERAPLPPQNNLPGNSSAAVNPHASP